MSIRADKVAHAIMREVSTVIQRDLHDPHIGFVTDDALDLDPALVVVVSQVAFIEPLRRDTSVEAQSAEEQREEADAG